MAGSISSQYLSGLMMAAPIALSTRPLGNTIEIGVVGELVSRPYVDMTAEVMRALLATSRMLVAAKPLSEKSDAALSITVSNLVSRGMLCSLKL